MEKEEKRSLKEEKEDMRKRKTVLSDRKKNNAEGRGQRRTEMLSV